MPRAVIIAGPNGAGKTTFARALFELEFEGSEQLAYHLNADELARARNLGPITAGRAMLEALEQAVAEQSDFVVETTLASRGYARRIPEWQAAGYDVSLHFLALPTADAAVVRVARRVAAGGHNVPEADIRRRYHRGLDLFERTYKVMVDRWIVWQSKEGGFENVQSSD